MISKTQFLSRERSSTYYSMKRDDIYFTIIPQGSEVEAKSWKVESQQGKP